LGFLPYCTAVDVIKLHKSHGACDDVDFVSLYGLQRKLRLGACEKYLFWFSGFD